MKGILYPTSPEQVASIMGGQQLFCTVGKSMNETAGPMPVYLYETKTAGGPGLVTAVMWVGHGHECQRGEIDLAAAMTSCPKVPFSAAEIGGKARYFYEILHRERLDPPRQIRDVVWRGSTKPPLAWKVVEV